MEANVHIEEKIQTKICT